MSPPITRSAAALRRPSPRRGAGAGARAPQGLGPSRGNIARPFALVVGVVYLAAGLIGFGATGFSGLVESHGPSLLGLHINIFHNIFHIVVGLAFIVVSQVRDTAITQGVLIGGGVIYLAAALLGFLDKLPIIAVNGSLALDNFFHLFSGAAAVLFGVLAAQQQSRAAPPSL
ncbi:MAG: DUF4383 domain-containing protein [Actinomycetota bacterium]|nr:DUF4383 domain-containing protein [Actinomycetota bacterium]